MEINRFYTCQKRFEQLYDKYSRKDGFKSHTKEEYFEWKQEITSLLKRLIGLDKMEKCSLMPEIVGCVELENNILREKVIIQVEPEVYMPVYILIPQKGNNKCFIAPPGHQGGGKYSVAGVSEIPAVKDMIKFYNYDYGMQLAKLGYTVFCPDCRGFGERREEGMQGSSRDEFLNSSCINLSHMSEPLGIAVIGMLVWDLMRLIDYIYERGRNNCWNFENLGCIGFSGGGMQTLWLSALDERIKYPVISGYMYGYKDSLLSLHGNCSCNYVPNLWEHVDMGDIGALIAPRKVMLQSCRGDHLNGKRGILNVIEQVEIMRKAYRLFEAEDMIYHDICEGSHRWHNENLEGFLINIT